MEIGLSWWISLKIDSLQKLFLALANFGRSYFLNYNLGMSKITIFGPGMDEKVLVLWPLKFGVSKKIVIFQFIIWSTYLIQPHSDKNRQGVYQFSFMDYINRLPVYYPPGYTGFQALPKGWNCLKKPTEQSKSTCWMINLTGIPL